MIRDDPRPHTADATDAADAEGTPEGGRAAHQVRVTLVAWPVAGIYTHFKNLAPRIAEASNMRAKILEIETWRHGGAVEKLTWLPQRARGSLRTYYSALPIYRLPAPDVVWTQVLPPIAPFILGAAARHLPVIFDSDTTPQLLASFGQHYAEQIAGPSLKRRAVDAVFGAAARRCARIVGWSAWAARSFERDYGVDSERIRVIPPGVDVNWWQRPDNTPDSAPVDGRRVRLLFVGGDFERKGGDLLLDVWRRHFADGCELHLVTKAEIHSEPGMFVHRDLTPNDERLRRLYHTCDVMALPTRGDCYSLASIEAMVAGLPVITTAVGGIPEIVDDGRTGCLIAPNDGAALRGALEALVSDGARRKQMGTAGRHKAVERFNVARNGAQVVELLREVTARR